MGVMLANGTGSGAGLAVADLVITSFDYKLYGIYVLMHKFCTS